MRIERKQLVCFFRFFNAEVFNVTFEYILDEYVLDKTTSKRRTFRAVKEFVAIHHLK